MFDTAEKVIGAGVAIVLIVLAGLAIFSTPAQAMHGLETPEGLTVGRATVPVICAEDVKPLLKFAAEQYQESIVGVGTNSQGSVFLLTQSKKGTWSFIATKPNKSCLFFSGNEFTLVDPAELEDKSGSKL